MSKKVWIWLGGIAMAVLLFHIFYATGNDSTFTVYPVGCSDWYTPLKEAEVSPSTSGVTPLVIPAGYPRYTPPAVQDFASCHRPEAMKRQTFTVDISKNRVIETSPDGSDVDSLNNCTIQDTGHWSCGSGDFSQMPGGILGATQIRKSGDNFDEYGLEAVIFVTEAQWDSINNGAPSSDK